MPIPIHQITCKTKDVIANEVYDITFSKPVGFTFKPGQFALIKVPFVDNREDIQTRALSIASAPFEDDLLFNVKLIKGGRISRWIEEVLQVGDTMDMQGPFGNFVLDRATEKDYLFIATSTGTAPFRSQIMSALKEGDTRRIDLVFGVRAEEDMFWKTEFEELAKKHENLFVHFALSQPSEEWKGHKGRVQTLVPQIVKDFSMKNVYVCGSPDMTKEVKQLCLEQWGVDKKDLHVEGYI